MSLIIAIFLIVILLCRVVGDKSKSAEYDRRKRERDKLISEWESRYTNSGLEKTLRRCIADPNNYGAVCEEIFPILSNTNHWSYLTGGRFVLNEDQVSLSEDRRQLGKNQRVALDIMLANRGKVSSEAAIYGYKAYVYFGTTSLKESSYEYANMLLGILNNHSAELKLRYYRQMGSESYIWIGSTADLRRTGLDHEAILPFDRDVLFKSASIPPIEQKKKG